MKRKNDELESCSQDPVTNKQPPNENELQDKFNQKISILLIENLIKFDTSNNFHLKRLISQLSNNCISKIPPAPKLYFQINELFNNYQLYFKNFFNKHKNRTYSLTLNKWNTDYVFFNIQYMDETFKYFDFPLGLFKLYNGRVDNGIIRNTILQDLTGKINFITTNFELDLKSKNIIKFLLNSNQSDTILICFPSFLIDSFMKFLKSYLKVNVTMIENLNIINGLNISNIEKLEKIYVTVCQEIIGKLQTIDLNYLTGLEFDEKMEFMNIFKDDKLSIILKIRNLVYFKKFLNDNDYNLLTSHEWQLIEFLTYITSINLKLLQFSINRNPLSNNLLQFIKYEIFLIDQMHQQFPFRYNLLPPGIFKSFEEFSIELENYHKLLSNKTNILMSTYLSPHTRKFLKSDEIQIIRNLLQTASNSRGNINDTTVNSSDDTSFNIDGLIMDAFECSGNINSEVLMFETIEYKAPQNLIQFWQTNHLKFPNLSQLAQEVLPIRINSDNKTLEAFKQQFTTILHDLNHDDICSIEAYYFIYYLSQEIDLLVMDPCNFELNIEQYQYGRSPSPGMSSLITSRDLKLPEM